MKHKIIRHVFGNKYYLFKYYKIIYTFQEIELQARRDQFRIEELRQEQILQKRQLPKQLKNEHKAQVNELRKAIRSKKTPNDKERFRQLDEQYVKRSQLETELMNEKQEKE